MSIYQYKNFHGRRWLRIFSHDIRNGKQFSKIDDALYIINDSDRFSILSEVTNRDKFGESFYFMLEFNSSELFIIWKQNDNPLEINESQLETSYVPGFLILENNTKTTGFGGLARTNRTPCIPSLLSSNINSIHWFYAIGVVENCEGGYSHTNRLPGPNAAVYQTSLWIKVQYFTCLPRRKHHDLLYSLILFLGSKK